MPHTASTIARLKAKIAEAGPDDCWEFQGCRGAKGYGRIHTPGGIKLAHRVSWEIHNGEIAPRGLVVRHKCDNPPCCNPNHLEIGTYAQNTEDAIVRGRLVPVVGTHCRNGHEYTPENTGCKGKRRYRICLDCRRENNRKLSRLRRARMIRIPKSAVPILLSALQYARNLVGPDEVIDEALSRARPISASQEQV